MNLRIVGTDNRRNQQFQQQAFQIGVAQPAQTIANSVNIASETSRSITEMLSNSYDQLNQVISVQTQANNQRREFNQTQLQNFANFVNSAIEQERKIQQQKAQSNLDERRFQYQQRKDRRDFQYRSQSDAYDRAVDERNFKYGTQLDAYDRSIDERDFQYRTQSDAYDRAVDERDFEYRTQSDAYDRAVDERDFEYRQQSDAYDRAVDERDFEYRTLKDKAELELDLAEFEYRQQQDYLDRQNQLLSEAEKRRAETNFVEAWVEVKAFTANADQIIAETSAAEFERQALEILSKYPYVTNEDREKIITEIFNASGRVRKTTYSKAQERVEQINAERVGIAQSELELRLAGTLGQLKNTRNPEKAGELLDKATEILNNFINENEDLDLLSTLEIYNHGLREISKYAQDNAELQALIQERLQGFENFYAELQPYAKLLQEDKIDYNTYLLRAQQLGDKYGVPSGLVADISDPNAGVEMLANHGRALSEIQQIEQDDYTRSLRDSNFYQGYTADLAFIMINDRALYQKYTSSPGLKDNPYVRAAKELADQYQGYQEDAAQYKIDLAIAERERAAWNSATISKFIKNSTTPEAREDLLKYLKENYPGAPPPPELLYDEENEEALNLWKEWRQRGADAIIQESQARGEKLRADYPLIFQYGLDGDEYTAENFDKIKERFGKRVEEQQEYLNRRQQLRQENAQQQSFFNGGYRENSSYTFATIKNPEGETLALPFRPDTQGLAFRHGRGEAGTARSGYRKRAHAGIDILAPLGTPIVSMTNGEVVLRRENPGGYGLYIDIKAEDGTIHRFAHLQSASVNVGDKVSIGQEVAKIGISGNAKNTPPHLHMELRTSQESFGYTSSGDIEKYLRTAHSQGLIQTPKTRRNNAEGDAYKESGGIPIESTGFLQSNLINLDGELIRAETVYNQSNPLPAMNYTGWNLEESGFTGKNDPEANYGYSYLANNPHVARKLAEISDRLGVPAHWIADIIAHESKWKVSGDGGNQNKYSGLIQFGDAAATDIGTTRAALKKMNHVEQLEYVYRYFNLPHFRGKLKSVAHVLAAVWGGSWLVNKLENEGFSESVLAVNDSSETYQGITFRQYLTERLGRDVGRKYNFPFLRSSRVGGSALTHDTYTASCPVCNELQANSSFVVHEGLA